jgi:hypothetical protein
VRAYCCRVTSNHHNRTQLEFDSWVTGGGTCWRCSG